MLRTDVAVIGAGAAGMMCAIVAGRRGRRVTVIDHAKAAGEKIRISGGGRCNFTNLGTSPRAFLSQNPHFAKSALARFTPADFIAMVEAHGIAWHEKTLGQLFCDHSARDIVTMLLKEMAAAGVRLSLSTEVGAVRRAADGFTVETSNGTVLAESLVIASGGKSIPKMGATGLAYKIAESFGLPLVETRPGLVPFTLDPLLLEKLAPLAGIAVEAEAVLGKTRFREALLFTHRGLSGPAALQISSYWREGDSVRFALLPDTDLLAGLRKAKAEAGRSEPQTALAQMLPKRLAQYFVETLVPPLPAGRPLADLPDRQLAALAEAIAGFSVKPAGTEGYRTAEVTLGGVDTRALDSRSMQAAGVPGLYFIGECVDVTGWLGGYNFQWAWASGHAAGAAV